WPRHLYLHPESGVVIPGTGGLRKLRRGLKEAIEYEKGNFPQGPAQRMLEILDKDPAIADKYFVPK
ncbi:MAG: hypothetical protein ACYC38_10685, partial [Eubacteriales bacterium]